MNKFYGKKMSKLSSIELTLLSLDIQISNIRRNPQLGNTDKMLREMLVTRAEMGIVCGCMYGEDYSRVRFEEDFNSDMVEKHVLFEVGSISLN